MGGIYVNAGVERVTINDSTISGNTADLGGALYSKYSNVEIYNSTIANNTATSDYAGLGIIGGELNIKNTIITNNYVDASRSDFYMSGSTVTDDGFNIIGASSGYSWTQATDWTFSGSDDVYDNIGGTVASGKLQLATSLGDHEGPTQTLSLGGDSIAIANGSEETTMTMDQRGYFRPRPSTAEKKYQYRSL